MPLDEPATSKEPEHSPSGHPSRSDDAKLVSRLLSGDACAWQYFVQRYGSLIRARVADVAVNFGSGHDDNAIDDAAAEVFAALLADEAAVLRAFVGRSSLLTYIAVIATRSSTRGFARRRPRTTSDEKLSSQVADRTPQSDPTWRIHSDEQRNELLRLLGELPAKQRDIVRLFHLEGLSYAEISQRLKMPIGSVGVTLKRAEKRLQDRLEPD